MQLSEGFQFRKHSNIIIHADERVTRGECVNGAVMRKQIAIVNFGG